MSRIKVDAIQGTSGTDTAITLSGANATVGGTLAVTGVHTVGNNAIYTSEGGGATQNTVQGIAKCWCHCNQATPSIDDSFNSASLTDIGTGLSTINFTNSMSNASFSAHYTHHDNLLNAAVGEFTLTSFRLDSRNDAGSYTDQTNACGTVHGDLA